VTLLLPGVWASMLAGALYGTWWGSVVVFGGACLGAELVFLLGRSWLRGWARRRLAGAPTLLALEQAVSREGLRLVLLTRLSPAFPFSLLNLAYGLSEVSLRDYTLGLIPGTWAVRILGIVATVAASLLITRVARRALAVDALGADALGADDRADPSSAVAARSEADRSPGADRGSDQAP
jgi:uncharacterized membrane protein YdjX (TVP38/TMEM64 family)